MNTLVRDFKRLDFTLIGTLLFLALFSCIALFTSTYGKTGSDVPTHILSKQMLYEMLGLIAMLYTALRFDYRSLRDKRWWLYGATIFLLGVVFVLPSRFGAHSWIPLGMFAFQPSEFAKLSLIIGIAGYIANSQEKEQEYRFTSSIPIWAMFIVPFLLTLKEPALGQALVMLAITVAMYMMFVKKSHYLILNIAFVIFVLFIVFVAIYLPQQSTVFIQNVLIRHHILQPFQADRIITWLNPNFDTVNAGYNVHQAELAVGSGEIFGSGFLKGSATFGSWIPNQWTDFVFTSIAEQFGFIGSSVLVLTFSVLIYRLIRTASDSHDPFGMYLIVGLVSMFAFQVFENIGMNMYLSPATGITLPFISYGGSSLIANYFAAGLILNISIKNDPLRFS